MDWYDSLAKPAWTPPGSVIGTIWTVLYPIIIVTYGWVFYRMVRGEIPWSVAVPVVINIVANVAFTPIQFGMRNLPLATIDIIIVLVTIVWSMIAIWPYSRVASLALSPYLLWVSIATTAQVAITWMNR